MLISPEKVNWEDSLSRTKARLLNEYQFTYEELNYIWDSLKDYSKSYAIKEQKLVDIEFLSYHWPKLSDTDSIITICEKKTLPDDLVRKIWEDYKLNSNVKDALLMNQSLSLAFITSIYPTLSNETVTLLIHSKKIHKDILSGLWHLIPKTKVDERCLILKIKDKNDWSFIKTILYDLSDYELRFLNRHCSDFIASLPIEALSILITSSDSSIRKSGIRSATNIEFKEN